MDLPWLKSLALFGQELVNNPRPMGAACPSSPRLAQRVASMVGAHPENLILEIGAGTGSLTAALLKHCVPVDRLLALERSTSLAQFLRQRFGGLRVIEGDACELVSTLQRVQDLDFRRITHVVSSLPLKSLPADQVEQITDQLMRLMQHGAKLIQYTYDLKRGSGGMFRSLERSATSVVWLNFPPARVEVFAASRWTSRILASPVRSAALPGSSARRVTASPRD